MTSEQRELDYSEPAWWPPRVGDKLRNFTRHGSGGGRLVHVHVLNHVLAVFEHEGRTMATVAEWFPSKHRWNYETISGIAARFSYWPDGQEPPEKHESSSGELFACCEPKAKGSR